MRSIKCVSRAARLPFEVADASRSEEQIKAGVAKGEQWATVGQDLRLNDRFIDLRTPANQGIMRLQSTVCQVSLSEAHRKSIVPRCFTRLASPPHSFTTGFTAVRAGGMSSNFIRVIDMGKIRI